jgi:cytochrome c-type biogenesis protein CcmE
MTTGKKIAIGGAIVAGLTAYMAYRGASAGWQYYLTADECRAESASLAGRRLRVSGRIAAGTLALDRDRSQASFSLEAGGANLKVTCSGPLPDNLAEGIAVLVEGRLDETGLFRGDKVLTRCASKYESRLPASVAQPATVVPHPKPVTKLEGGS